MMSDLSTSERRHSPKFANLLKVLPTTHNVDGTFLWPPYVIGGPLYFCPVVTIFLSFYLFFFLA